MREMDRLVDTLGIRTLPNNDFSMVWGISSFSFGTREFFKDTSKIRTNNRNTKRNQDTFLFCSVFCWRWFFRCYCKGRAFSGSPISLNFISCAAQLEHRKSKVATRYLWWSPKGSMVHCAQPRNIWDTRYIFRSGVYRNLSRIRRTRIKATVKGTLSNTVALRPSAWWLKGIQNLPIHFEMSLRIDFYPCITSMCSPTLDSA